MCSFPSSILSPVYETEAQRHLVRSADSPAAPARHAVLNRKFWSSGLGSGSLHFTNLLFFQMNARSLSVINNGILKACIQWPLPCEDM